MTTLIISENGDITLTPEQAKALTKVAIGGKFENAVLLNKYLGRMSVPMAPEAEFDEVLNTVAAYSLVISVEGRCFSGVDVPTVSASGDSWEFKNPFFLLESYAEQVTTQHVAIAQPS
ncbi:hypothetical protein ABXK20_000406 [Serratia marcescens]|uniref:hypothetical protein n=1 Tax=Serratia TaxID=613 RepID=UPI00066A8360|nr:hypothetical protein [Serratia marcescens]ELY1860907.1 hypothetical protein [Serratia marcescens]MBI6133099.1 hypothetical protein [Serratia marcescens]MCA4110045.1 hypothetical protein [Serratia marcescens]MDN0027256.1 hypothetical protein [Serratia marcescens]NSM20612.1 hypothetical protein [Serratia marcescens]